jgi:hypothetical protein
MKYGTGSSDTPRLAITPKSPRKPRAFKPWRKGDFLVWGRGTGVWFNIHQLSSLDILMRI